VIGGTDVADLKVDTEVLWEAGSSLRTVYEAFKDADGRADVDRSVIAHGTLRDRLDDFADNWDDKREKMQGEIEGLGEIAEGAAESYERIETEFVAALEGQKQ
jgi:hypothetical protein